MTSETATAKALQSWRTTEHRKIERNATNLKLWESSREVKIDLWIIDEGHGKDIVFNRITGMLEYVGTAEIAPG